jgi:hypothetical protein
VPDGGALAYCKWHDNADVTILMKHRHALVMLLLLVALFPLMAIAQQPVVVGVSGTGPSSQSVRHIMKQLHARGAYPVLLDLESPEDVRAHLDHVHGVIIAGNSLDINPADFTVFLFYRIYSFDRIRNKGGVVAGMLTENQDQAIMPFVF